MDEIASLLKQEIYNLDMLPDPELTQDLQMGDCGKKCCHKIMREHYCALSSARISMF